MLVEDPDVSGDTGFSKFEVTSSECLKLRKEEFRFKLSTLHFTLPTSMLDAGYSMQDTGCKIQDVRWMIRMAG